MCEQRLLNIVVFTRVWLLISYLLMASIYQTRNSTQRKGSVSFRCISSSALRWKEMSEIDYCQSVLTSTFFCCNCWVLCLSRCICSFCLYFWRGQSLLVCVCAWGHCVYLGAGTAVLFNLLTPQYSRCGLQGVEWAGRCQQSRIERKGDMQHL